MDMLLIEIQTHYSGSFKRNLLALISRRRPSYITVSVSRFRGGTPKETQCMEFGKIPKNTTYRAYLDFNIKVRAHEHTKIVEELVYLAKDGKVKPVVKKLNELLTMEINARGTYPKKVRRLTGYIDWLKGLTYF